MNKKPNYINPLFAICSPSPHPSVPPRSRFPSARLPQGEYPVTAVTLQEESTIFTASPTPAGQPGSPDCARYSGNPVLPHPGWSACVTGSTVSRGSGRSPVRTGTYRPA